MKIKIWDGNRAKAMALTFVMIFFHAIGFAWADGSEKAPPSGLENRIDFGNAYILGQSIKSGAVYLMQRKQTEIQSMLKVREDYRKEILEAFPLYDPKSVDHSDRNSKE